MRFSMLKFYPINLNKRVNRDIRDKHKQEKENCYAF